MGDAATPSLVEKAISVSVLLYLPRYYNGLDWTGLDWTGLDWTGLDWTGLDWTATPTLGFFSINTRSIRCFARFLLGTYLTVDADVSISTSV